MGSIYKQAEEVISWLGNDEPNLRWLDLGAGPSLWDILKFRTLPYWYRAWITQEIALARRVVLMAGPRQVELTDPGCSRVLDPVVQLRPSHWNTLIGSSLIELLKIFHHHKCSEWQDVVYSLSALCREGRALRIDYTLTREELLLHVLQCTRDRLCFCSVTVVARAVGLRWESRDLWPKSVSSTPLVKLRIPNACREEEYCIESLGSSTGEPNGDSNRFTVPATSHDFARFRSIRLKNVCRLFEAKADLMILHREGDPLRSRFSYLFEPSCGLQYAEGITRHMVADEAGAYCELHLTLAVLLELVNLASCSPTTWLRHGMTFFCDPPLREKSSSNDVHLGYPKLTLCCETDNKETQETVDV